jgi:hypothetical protein
MEESRSEKKKHKKNKEYEDDKILFQYQQAESLKITALMTGIDRKINDIDKKINTYKESVLKDINNIGGIMIYFKDVKAEFKKALDYLRGVKHNNVDYDISLVQEWITFVEDSRYDLLGYAIDVFDKHLESYENNVGYEYKDVKKEGDMLYRLISDLSNDEYVDEQLQYIEERLSEINELYDKRQARNNVPQKKQATPRTKPLKKQATRKPKPGVYNPIDDLTIVEQKLVVPQIKQKRSPPFNADKEIITRHYVKVNNIIIDDKELRDFWKANHEEIMRWNIEHAE